MPDPTKSDPSGRPMTPEDETFLRRAIALAAEARAAGEQPFGSLLVGPDARSSPRTGTR